MELIAEHIHKTYGTTTVIDDISFSLAKGQKIGLVGNNGTGKSTLLKILAGIVQPDGGTVTPRKGAVIGYMPQDTSLVSDETVRDYLRRVSGMQALEERLEHSLDALEEYHRRDGYTFYHRLEATLAGLGLTDISSDRRINSLSSGQKSKVAMAGVLLSDADVLLLDEPTNNLDLAALLWLEEFLLRSDSACILVSHDRLFLDRVVRKIFEIDWISRRLTITGGGYSDYLARKEKARVRQREQYEAQQEEIERLTEAVRAKRTEAMRGSRYHGSDNDKFLRGFKRDQAARSAKVAKAIEKRIEQMDLVEKPIEKQALRIDIKPQKPGGSHDIVLKDVMAGYPEGGFRIGPIALRMPYGSRVLILGLNGSGKSTLLKTISGQLEPLSGEVQVGSSLVIGDLMQEHDNLPRHESIKDLLIRRTGSSLEHAYTLAARFGLRADEIDREVAILSPGERARLLFAVFSALSVNVLLLDEPTNHLDLEALHALEEAVAQYAGTIVLVSHDRYFIERFRATDTYVLAGGKLTRQQTFEAYRAGAEQEAKRLINRL